MGSRRLWLVVEGRVHDSSFFDAMLATHPGLEGGYTVRLAETIEVDGTAAGGKSHVLAVMAWLDDADALIQQSKNGTHVIAFALDRDFDHLTGEKIKSDHVIYTVSMDVESEILLNGDLHAAASMAYSLTRENASRALPTSRELAIDLATRWREWISIGICAASCDIGTSVPFAQRSRINEHGYGPLVDSEAQKLRDDVISRFKDHEDLARFSSVSADVERIYNDGRQWTLVKGKWMAAFVWHLLAASLADVPRELNVKTETLAKTCIGTLDFQATWVAPYRSRLDTLLAA